MSSRTFRNKKSLRKTKRKRNHGHLKDAYLAMNVGGKLQLYKLNKARKHLKIGGMWPFEQPQPSLFGQPQPESQPSLFGEPAQPTMLENIKSAFTPKPKPTLPFMSEV